MAMQKKIAVRSGLSGLSGLWPESTDMSCSMLKPPSFPEVLYKQAKGDLNSFRILAEKIRTFTTKKIHTSHNNYRISRCTDYFVDYFQTSSFLTPTHPPKSECCLGL